MSGFFLRHAFQETTDNSQPRDVVRVGHGSLSRIVRQSADKSTAPSGEGRQAYQEMRRTSPDARLGQ
jgi:hypothetical protein